MRAPYRSLPNDTGPPPARRLKALRDRADNFVVDPIARTAGDRRPLEGLREQYMALLLQRFESGALEPYEYTRRVQALELAPSASAMVRIVDAPVTPGDEPALDAVDLALLARSASARPARDRRKPYLWLAAVGIFFVVLLVIGMWLVGHARALENSGNLGAGAGSSARSLAPAAAHGPGAVREQAVVQAPAAVRALGAV